MDLYSFLGLCLPSVKTISLSPPINSSAISIASSRIPPPLSLKSRISLFIPCDFNFSISTINSLYVFPEKRLSFRYPASLSIIYEASTEVKGMLPLTISCFIILPFRLIVRLTGVPAGPFTHCLNLSAFLLPVAGLSFTLRIMSPTSSFAFSDGPFFITESM